MTEQHPITPPPPHLLKKFSAQAQDEAKKRNGAGYLKTFAILCIEWAMNSKTTPNDRQIRSSEIEPPPELVRKWANHSASIYRENGTYAQHEFMLATQAARWGADMELEACCEWLEYTDEKEKLRTARRPKPPSLKEQALAVVENSALCDHLSIEHAAILRRALEALPD